MPLVPPESSRIAPEATFVPLDLAAFTESLASNFQSAAESAGLEGFKKVVAIKRVLPHLAEKKQFIGMFLDEARTSAHLSHSKCVQVFDIGVGDNTYFIVMEYVDGANLKTIVESLRRPGA